MKPSFVLVLSLTLLMGCQSLSQKSTGKVLPSQNQAAQAVSAFLDMKQSHAAIEEIRNNIFLDASLEPQVPLLVGFLATKGVKAKSINNPQVEETIRSLEAGKFSLVQLDGIVQVLLAYDEDTQTFVRKLSAKEVSFISRKELESRWSRKWQVQ